MTFALALGYAFFAFILIVRLTTATLTSTGQTVLLDDIPYYIPAAPFTTVSLLSSLKSLNSASGLVPVTVVGVSASNSSLSSLESTIDGFGSDDVWNQGFLEGKRTSQWREFLP